MSATLWIRLVSTCIAVLPLVLLLTVLLPFDPWFHRLKWFVGLDILLGFVLTMAWTWGWVDP